MLVNNITSFSSEELKATAKQINIILNKSNLNYSSQHIQKLLSSYGIKDVVRKHSQACRHRYWFYRPITKRNLKVTIKM